MIGATANPRGRRGGRSVHRTDSGDDGSRGRHDRRKTRRDDTLRDKHARGGDRGALRRVAHG